jgi:ferric-dicitrate binding protein FerR (iron transport regulator)
VKLSDEERRRLEQLERELAAEDPHLARILASGPRGERAAPARRAALAVIAGMVLVIAGIAWESAAFGLTGYLLTCAGVLRYFTQSDPDGSDP